MAKRNRNQKPRTPREPSGYRYRQVRAFVPSLTPVSQILGLVTQLRERQRQAVRPPSVDRRRWHPERWGQPVVATPRSAARIIAKPSYGPVLTSRLAFADPRHVAVCLRRKIRRQVIHALVGGGGGKKAPKRKPTSEISC